MSQYVSKCKHIMQCVLWMVMICGASGAPEAGGGSDSKKAQYPKLEKAVGSKAYNFFSANANQVTNTTNQCYIYIINAYIECITGNKNISEQAINHFNKLIKKEYAENNEIVRGVKERANIYFPMIKNALIKMRDRLNSFYNKVAGKGHDSFPELKSEMNMAYFISDKGIIKDEYVKEGTKTELNERAKQKIKEFILENFVHKLVQPLKVDIMKKIEIKGLYQTRIETTHKSARYRGEPHIEVHYETNWNPIYAIIHDRILFCKVSCLNDYLVDTEKIISNEYKFWQQVQSNAMTAELFKTMVDIIKEFDSFDNYRYLEQVYNRQLTKPQNDLLETLRSAIEIYPKIIKYCLDNELNPAITKSEDGTSAGLPKIEETISDMKKYATLLCDYVKKEMGEGQKSSGTDDIKYTNSIKDCNNFIEKWRKSFEGTPVTLTPTATR